METTKLTTESVLPLTCSRSGSCCFGKSVMLNPWELLNFSKEKGITTREFRDQYCDLGGIQLRFDGALDNKGQKACSQYVDGFGCSVHIGRPLACRLYPLGRQVQFDKAVYIFQGNKFPCLNDCSEVLELPKLSVGDYIQGQQAGDYEKVQDAYLIVMQNIANIAFELLLESGLSESGDTKTLAAWRQLGLASSDFLVERIGVEWMDCLMIPELPSVLNETTAFAQKHNELLLAKAQTEFGTIQTLEELHEASVLMAALALHLAKGLGADTKGISEHWVETAKKFGAKE